MIKLVLKIKLLKMKKIVYKKISYSLKKTFMISSLKFKIYKGYHKNKKAI